MKKKLNWTAVSNTPRIESIEHIKDAISSSNGYIVNFNMYSDLALSLSIEIEESSILKLHSALNNIVRISSLNPQETFKSIDKEWFVFLNISFGKGSGKLQIETPNVPG